MDIDDNRAALEPMTYFNGLLIIRYLASGGNALIYEAWSNTAGAVTLKVFDPLVEKNANRARAFFARERDALIALQGEQRVPQYVSSDLTVEPPFIVTNFLRGSSLSDMLLQGPVPLNVVLSIGIDVAQALARVHRRGLIHRDVSPGNIMCGVNYEVTLIDFGYVTYSVDHVPEGYVRLSTDWAIGTPAYISPEGARAKTVTPRTDIYSLGVTLFELLTGAPPFTTDDCHELILEHINMPPPPVSGYEGQTVERVIHRAMAKEPKDRYQTALHFASALRWCYNRYCA